MLCFMVHNAIWCDTISCHTTLYCGILYYVMDIHIDCLLLYAISCHVLPCYIRIHCYHTILCFIHYTLPNLVMPCHSIAHCIILNTTLYCSVQFHTKPDWIYFWIYAIPRYVIIWHVTLSQCNTILFLTTRYRIIA